MTWKRTTAVLPGIALPLLPNVTCPACWPAYAALLSSLGLSFVPLPTTYVMPLTAAFLLVAVAGLGFRARNRRGYRPMLLGLTASSVILFGKLTSDSSAVMYAGLSMLIAASLWNTWPIRSARQCPQCAPEGRELIQLRQEKSSERE